MLDSEYYIEQIARVGALALPVRPGGYGQAAARSRLADVDAQFAADEP
ncbi:MAG TPA: hypothetical protein VIJ07_00965 [Dermatophilaceae bacterium]